MLTALKSSKHQSVNTPQAWLSIANINAQRDAVGVNCKVTGWRISKNAMKKAWFGR